MRGGVLGGESGPSGTSVGSAALANETGLDALRPRARDLPQRRVGGRGPPPSPVGPGAPTGTFLRSGLLWALRANINWSCAPLGGRLWTGAWGGMGRGAQSRKRRLLCRFAGDFY